MKRSKKIFALGMSACMMASSLCGCSLNIGKKIGGSNDDELLDAADSFIEALLSTDSKKVSKTLVEDDQESDYLEELDSYDSTIVADILENAGYEADEDSVKVKKDEGSAEYEITIADPEDVADGSDIEDADEKSITVTIEFELDDDEWLVSNFEDVYEDIFDEDLTALADGNVSSKPVETEETTETEEPTQTEKPTETEEPVETTATADPTDEPAETTTAAAGNEGGEYYTIPSNDPNVPAVKTGNADSPVKIGEWFEVSQYSTVDSAYHTVYARITGVVRGDEAQAYVDNYNNTHDYTQFSEMEYDDIEYCAFTYELYYPTDFPEHDWGISTAEVQDFKIYNADGSGIFGNYMGLSQTWEAADEPDEFHSGETYQGLQVFAMVIGCDDFYVVYDPYRGDYDLTVYVDPNS